jgi:hypothetical protein
VISLCQALYQIKSESLRVLLVNDRPPKLSIEMSDVKIRMGVIP